MGERSPSERLGRIRALEREVMTSMAERHRDGGCAGDGTHTPECVAVFEKLGWGSYEQCRAAWEAEGLMRQRSPGAPALPIPVEARSSITKN